MCSVCAGVEGVKVVPSLLEPFRTFAYEVVDRFVLLLAEGAGLADQVRFVFVEVIVSGSGIKKQDVYLKNKPY